jgi:uncharacterized protein
VNRVLFILLFVLNQCIVFSQHKTFEDSDIPNRPTPAKLINDLSNTLSSNDIYQLESKLRSYMDTTSTQIAVVLVPSVTPYEISDYAIRLGRKWGVGQKDKNNGILLLLAIEDKKVDIETGYGIEGYISDGDARRIIRNDIAPNFTNKNYALGIDAATSSMIELLEGSYKASNDTSEDTIPLWLIILVVLLLLYIISKASKNNKGFTHDSGGWRTTRGTTWGGGGWSGGNWSGGGGGGGFDFGGGSFGGGGASGGWD